MAGGEEEGHGGGHGDHHAVSRMVMFSDAVFAIAATIQVLPLKLDPTGIADLDHELRGMKLDFAIYFITFLLISQIWKDHSVVFDRLRTVDEVIVWLNILLLLFVCFVPYTVAVLAEFYRDRTAILLNLIVFLLIAGVQCALLLYTHWRGKLLRGGNTIWHELSIALRIFPVPLIFLIGYLASLASLLGGYITLGVLLPLQPLIVNRLQRVLVGHTMSSSELMSQELAKHRLMTFADGVFSIAITLIVLDIDVPASDADNGARSGGRSLSTVLIRKYDEYLAFLYSAAAVALLWIVHNSVFRHLKSLNALMRLFNTWTLSLVAFIPFVSSLLSEYSHHYESNERVATRLAAGTMLIAGGLQSALWLVATTHKQGKLVSTAVQESKRLSRNLLAKTAVVPVCMFVVVLLSFVSSRTASIGMDVMMLLSLAAMVTLSAQTHRYDSFGLQRPARPNLHLAGGGSPVRDGGGMDDDSDDDQMLLSPILDGGQEAFEL